MKIYSRILYRLRITLTISRSKANGKKYITAWRKGYDNHSSSKKALETLSCVPKINWKGYFSARAWRPPVQNSASANHACVQQILECYKSFCSDGSALIGLQKSPVDAVSYFSAATGTWLGDNNGKGGEVMKISVLKEKPSQEDAKNTLCVPGYDSKTFLTIFGYYVVPPIIFEYLETQHNNNLRDGHGQFGFTDVLQEVMQKLELRV